MCVILYFYFFFFQAEDGIRDYKVTGVQTCALPIYPLAGLWTESLPCTLEGGNPKRPLLLDNISNTQRLLIISKRLKACLEKQAVPDVEYLPLTLLDDKERVASDSYFIAHLLHRPDCLD